MTRPLTGTHVLLGLLAFFGVMLAANGTFVYFATTSFSGLSTEDAYRKGLAYNDTIRAFERQQADGWRSEVGVDGPLVRLRIQNAEGRPVDGLAIAGRIGRPATDAADRALTFRGQGEGLYVAEAGSLSPGQWLLTAEARPEGADDAAPFKVTARLWHKQ